MKTQPKQLIQILYAEQLAQILYCAFEKNFTWRTNPAECDSLYNVEEPVYINGVKHIITAVVRVYSITNAEYTNKKCSLIKVNIIHFNLYTADGITATKVLVARYCAEKRLFELIKYKIEN